TAITSPGSIRPSAKAPGTTSAAKRVYVPGVSVPAKVCANSCPIGALSPAGTETPVKSRGKARGSADTGTVTAVRGDVPVRNTAVDPPGSSTPTYTSAGKAGPGFRAPIPTRSVSPVP